MHVHDLPLHPTALAVQAHATSSAETIALRESHAPDDLLPDVPGP